MPVEWTYPKDSLRLQGPAVGVGGGISAADADRQSVTAAAIVDHLGTQPGMILADEVGMGKTYVALAVVASVLASTRKRGAPVVVMVPPGLLGKWQREWRRFKTKCTVGSSFAWMDGRDKVATSPAKFFKLLDDEAGSEARLIFLKTSCFAQGLGDPWIKLALVRYARTHTRMLDEERKRIHKWAGVLTRQEGKHLSPDLVEQLLGAEPMMWKAKLVGEGLLSDADDDPVPGHLDACRDKLDYADLIEVIRNELPGRSGGTSKETLQRARKRFNEACQDLHRQWLRHAKWKASLLVLDEAHHAKNDSTQLAGLFRSEDLTALVEGRDDAVQPDLWQKADRMLFLTATPFQLGHDELIRVLRSFAAVRWNSNSAPIKTREDFLRGLEVLKARLNENRLAGRDLDTRWGRWGAGPTEEASSQGQLVSGPPASLPEEVASAIAQCRRTKLAAERDTDEPWNGLSHWVVRHNRRKDLPPPPSEPNRSPVLRRSPRAGLAIMDADERPSSSSEGLKIGDAPALPFLLSARAQAELAAASARSRAFFAEGLSSSYEAFHHTRDNRTDARDDRATDDRSIDGPSEVVVPLEWYEDHIAELIPQKNKTEECFEHPKIRAVVDRAIALWRSGEKVLIFAFYRETVKALRDHLRREADKAIGDLAASRLGMPAKAADEAHDIVLRIGKRFADSDSPFQGALKDLLEEELNEYPMLAARHDEIFRALVTYVRTPAFIARFMPLDDAAFQKAVQFAESRSEVVRAGVEAFKVSFASREDGSPLCQCRVRQSLLET